MLLLAVTLSGRLCADDTPPTAAPKSGGWTLPADLPALPTDPRDVQRLRRFLPAGEVHETPHFLIVHNTDAAHVHDTAALLEQTYAANWRLARDLGVEPTPPNGRLPVLLLRTYQAYADLCAARDWHTGSAGLYVREHNFIALYDIDTLPAIVAHHQLNATADPNDPDEQARRALAEQLLRHLRGAAAHEAAHIVQFNIGLFDRDIDVPAWLVEGLATPFETWTPGDGHPLDTLQLPPTADPPVALASDEETLAALRRLVTGRDEWRDAEQVLLSAALVHGLWQERRDGLRRLMAAWRQQGGPDDPVAAFEHHCGPLDDRLAAPIRRAVRTARANAP